MPKFILESSLTRGGVGDGAGKDLLVGLLEPEDLGRLCIQEQLCGPLDSLPSPTPSLLSKVLSRFKVGSLGSWVSYWF